MRSARGACCRHRTPHADRSVRPLLLPQRMQLTAENLSILPRAADSAVGGPAPTIAKRTRPPAATARPIAGAFVEITTAEKAARVHRNRQLAATTLATIKQTLGKLEADNASLKQRDATLATMLADLLPRVAAAKATCTASEA